MKLVDHTSKLFQKCLCFAVKYHNIPFIITAKFYSSIFIDFCFFVSNTKKSIAAFLRCDILEPFAEISL